MLSPDLPVEPAEAIKLLRKIIGENPVRLLIGASLGGYYADYLNSCYGIPAVLINPSTRPFETLKNYLGENTNWCSGESFEWLLEYCDTLASLYREAPTADERYLVLLQSADEVLDYRLAEARYRHHRVIVEQGGNHRFENLGDYLPVIEEFLEVV